MSTPNPYAAPRATVADAVSPQQGNFVPGGHGVPAGNGWTWIADAWELFKRQPGMWIAIVLALFILLLVAAFIPFVGSLAMMVLFPVFVGGLMLGCQALAGGGRLEFAHLFAGFRERAGPLAAVGALYLVASLAIALVVGVITGVGVMTMMTGPGADAANAAGALTSFLLASLVMMALMIPVVMAVWFAAPLVVFHERGAVDALKESFSGCLKNIVPFLVYGVVLLLLGIVASIPMALGWLVLGPMAFASVYTAYRDIYFTA